MYNKRIQVFSVQVFVLISLFSCGQDQKMDESQIVESFFQDVYSNNKSLDKISKEYRYLPGNEKFHEKFIKNIKYLQMDKKHLYNKIKNIKVEPYEDCKIDGLWRFEKKEGEYICVVSTNDKVETYVLLKDSKIVSFVYFRKGSDNPAYFVPYWELPTE